VRVEWRGIGGGRREERRGRRLVLSVCGQDAVVGGGSLRFWVAVGSGLSRGKKGPVSTSQPALERERENPFQAGVGRPVASEVEWKRKRRTSADQPSREWRKGPYLLQCSVQVVSRRSCQPRGHCMSVPLGRKHRCYLAREPPRTITSTAAAVGRRQKARAREEGIKAALCQVNRLLGRCPRWHIGSHVARVFMV
jgi:hypothetical protein